MTYFTESNFFALLLATLNSQLKPCQILEEPPALLCLVPIAAMFALIGMAFQTSGELSERSPEQMQRDAQATIKRLLAKFGGKQSFNGCLRVPLHLLWCCLLYTSDAADE